MSRRRQVGVAHTEIDDVRPRIAGRRLGTVHLFENIRRQPSDAVKFFHVSNLLPEYPVTGGHHRGQLVIASCPSDLDQNESADYRDGQDEPGHNLKGTGSVCPATHVLPTPAAKSIGKRPKRFVTASYHGIGDPQQDSAL